MAGFLYHIAGEQRPPAPAKIDAWGLRYAFPDGSPTHRAVMSSSPSGKSGSIIADDARQSEKDVGYYPDQQTWEKLPAIEGRPELWIGFWNDAPPRPDDLRRSPLIEGIVSYQAGDGCRWIVPTLVELDDAGAGDCILPATERLRDGEYRFELLPPMAKLWEIVHPVALGLCGFAASPPAADVKAAAIALLAANYVLDRPELAVLGALANDDRYERIVMASCRGQWMLEAIRAAGEGEKKTDGPPDEST